MAEAVAFAIHPTDGEKMLVLWSDGRITARGGQVAPPPIDYQTGDPDRTDMVNDTAVSLQVTDWITPSGYVGTARGHLRVFGAAAEDSPAAAVTADQQWRDWYANPAATGAAYRMNWFGQLESIGGASAITGQSDVLTPARFSRAFAMDWTSKKYIVVSGNGTLFLRNGATLAAGPLPKVTEGWDRVVAIWVDPDSWATGARGYTLDVYGSLFAFGGLPDPSQFERHWETSVIRDLAVRTYDPDPLAYRILDYAGVPHLVVASSAPTVTVTAPVKTVADTTRPRITWDFVDPEGDPQAYAEIKLFTKAQRQAADFDVDTSTAFHTARVEGNLFFYDLPVDLANGRWFVFVRAADTAKRISDWDESGWPQGVVYPTVPELTITEDVSTPGPAASILIGEPVGVGAGRKAIMGGSLTRHAANEAGRLEPSSGWDPKYPNDAYDGGTIPAWYLNTTASGATVPRRTALTDYEATRPAPVVWWFQVLLHDADIVSYTEAQLKSQAEAVVDWMRTVWNVPIYVSPSPYYEEGTRCTQDDANTILSENIVSHLISAKGCFQGPVMPLVEARLVQPTSCHLIEEGRIIQAEVLLDFFAPAEAAFVSATVPQVDPVDVTLYGASGTFGTWSSPLPRGHTGTTEAVAGWTFPDQVTLGPPAAAPDGQVVVAARGYPEKMPVFVFDPDGPDDYTVEVLTTTGATAVTPGAPGNGGASIQRFHVVRTASGQRLVGFSKEPYANAQNIATEGEFPTMVVLRKKATTGLLVVDKKLTFTAGQLRDKAVAGIGAANADLLFPSATNGFGQTYRKSPLIADTALLADRQHVVWAVAQSSGRSGFLAVVDATTGEVKAYYDIPDQNTVGGLLPTLTPRQVAASPVALASGLVRFAVVYDVSGDGLTADMAQVFTFDPATFAVAPETTAFWPVADDWVLAGETEVDQSGSVAHVSWHPDGSLWAGTVLSTAPTASSDTHFYCDGGVLYTEAAATAGWETRAGQQPSPDGLVLPPRVSPTSAMVGATFDPATGRRWELQEHGDLVIYQPDEPFVARTEMLANPDFAVDVADWSSPSATATITHSATDDGRMSMVKAGAGTEAEATSSAAPIDSAYRDTKQTIFGWADVKAVTAAREFRVEIVQLDAANAVIVTSSGPWRPSSTSEYRRVFVTDLYRTNATQAKLVVRFRGATIGDEMVVSEATLRFAPVTTFDYIDIGAGAGSYLPSVAAVTGPAVAAHGFAWVAAAQAPAATDQLGWLFAVGITPSAFASVSLTALAVDTPHYAELQFSDDGETWHTVRDADALALNENLFGDATDPELPANRERLYRLRVWREYPGFVSSEWGPETAFTLTGVTDGYLSDPTDPDSAIAVPVIEVRYTRERQAGVFYADGRADAIVRRGIRRKRKGTLPLRLLDRDTHDAVQALLEDGQTLLYRDTLGDTLYFAPLNDDLTRLRLMPETGEAYPLRHAHELNVEFVEVKRPT